VNAVIHPTIEATPQAATAVRDIWLLRTMIIITRIAVATASIVQHNRDDTPVHRPKRYSSFHLPNIVGTAIKPHATQRLAR
jgi:hypothetical protein